MLINYGADIVCTPFYIVTTTEQEIHCVTNASAQVANCSKF